MSPTLSGSDKRGAARRGVMAVALLAACSVSDDPGGPQGPGQSFTTYLSDVATAVIDYEKACNLLDASRVDARRALLALSFPSYLTEVKDVAAKQGRTTYSAACVRAGLQEAACSPDAAGAVLQTCAGREAVGRLTSGRICRLHDECKDGYCKGVPLADQCGSGTCAPLGGLGAACPEGARACDASGFACQGGACFPRAAAGGTCRDDQGCKDGLRCIRASMDAAEGACGTVTPGQPGAPCDLLGGLGKGCSTGYACYKDSNSTYLCQPIIPVGQPCKYSESCAAPATCVLEPQQMTGTCKALGKPGDPCDLARGSACQTTLRCYALDVAAQAVCTPLPLSTERCDGDRLPCLSGVCSASGSGSTCRPRSGAGLACTGASECATNLCDAATRTCKAPVCS